MRFLIAMMLLAGMARADEPTPIGAVFNDCTDCPDMVVLPAGSAEIGATAEDIAMIPADQAALEQPRHKVTLHTFAIGRSAVTRAQFSAFVFDTGYDVKGSCAEFNLPGKEFKHPGGMTWLEPGFIQGDNDPVVCVNIPDVTAYLNWLTNKTRRPYRLPSEAEWEYAARAGTMTVRYWGSNSPCRYANVADRAAVTAGLENTPAAVFDCNDGHALPARIGSFQPNAFGLYDMLGNVAQWVADCVHPNYNGAPADGSVWRGDKGCAHVLRGSAWSSPPLATRAARRSSNPADARGNVFGFRVARDLEPPQ